MNSMINNTNNHYISHEDICRDATDFGDLNINELGNWLMTRTADNFTLSELEDISRAFATFEDIAERVHLFKKEWAAKMATIEVEDYPELYTQYSSCSVDVDNTANN